MPSSREMFTATLQSSAVPYGMFRHHLELSSLVLLANLFLNDVSFSPDVISSAKMKES